MLFNLINKKLFKTNIYYQDDVFINNTNNQSNLSFIFEKFKYCAIFNK